MPDELDTSAQERELLLDALREGLRLDGRELNDLRKLEISFGDDYGSVEVKLGKTRYGILLGISD